jgi:hypothetical protein
VNLSRILVGPVVLAMLCACGGSKPEPGPTPSPSPSPCQAAVDTVTPLVHPLIDVSPTSAATPSAIATQAPLTCDTTLSVTQGGSATATFGATAACTLKQGGSPVGMLVSRFPKDTLFTLSEGEVWCRGFTSQQQEAVICGQGMVSFSMRGKWNATCPSSHAFRVEVYSGTMVVRYPTGSELMPPKHKLVFDPLTRAAPVTPTTFSTSDVNTFAALEV